MKQATKRTYLVVLSDRVVHYEEYPKGVLEEIIGVYHYPEGDEFAYMEIRGLGEDNGDYGIVVNGEDLDENDLGVVFRMWSAIAWPD